MKKEVTVSISDEIFKLVPGYRRAVVVAHGVKNQPSSPELQKLLAQEVQNVRQHINLDDPGLVAWREVFLKAAIKPNKFRPSIDGLVRRILNGGSLSSISTIVDIGTIISLRFVLPCGAHSLNDVQHELVLRSATGTETFTPFGTEQAETVKPGEIIYTDGNLVATSKWAWRQANHTVIRPETTAFELNIDALSVVDEHTLAAAIRDAEVLIKEFLGVEARVYRIDSKTAHIEIEAEASRNI